MTSTQAVLDQAAKIEFDNLTTAISEIQKNAVLMNKALIIIEEHHKITPNEHDDILIIMNKKTRVTLELMLRVIDQLIAVDEKSEKLLK